MTIRYHLIKEWYNETLYHVLKLASIKLRLHLLFILAPKPASKPNISHWTRIRRNQEVNKLGPIGMQEGLELLKARLQAAEAGTVCGPVGGGGAFHHGTDAEVNGSDAIGELFRDRCRLARDSVGDQKRTVAEVVGR